MAERGNSEPRYPMRAVIKRTGLTADLLRAWERRYGVVSPARSGGGQRLYSDEDVSRLTLIRRATNAGHRIAEVARLDMAALEALFEEPKRADQDFTEAVDSLVARAIAATEQLEGEEIEAILKRGALALGVGALVDQVISRFLNEVGERWHSGALSPAHEHLASAAVRRVLGWAMDVYVPGPRAPRLIVATAAGEQHEFGAMLAAGAAVEEGWRVIYLGANLPALDLARAAAQVGARAVAVSAVYVDSDIAQILATAERLPSATTLFVGGRALAASCCHRTRRPAFSPASPRCGEPSGKLHEREPALR